MGGAKITQFKKCQKCGKSFSVNSSTGNPYKMCTNCRLDAHDKFAKLAKEIYKK